MKKSGACDQFSGDDKVKVTPILTRTEDTKMGKMYILLVAIFLSAISGCNGLQGDMVRSGLRFTVSYDAEAGCVTDNRTGLMWVKNVNSAGRSWYNALDYVATMNSGKGFCGHNDWRLPSRSELRSLVNRSQVSTAHWLNTQGFSNVQTYYYWSSTTNGVGSGEAWIVYMLDGLEAYFPMTNLYNVWPVRTIR
jgi:hypothetical protein